jgi:hypothetical protein
MAAIVLRPGGCAHPVISHRHHSLVQVERSGGHGGIECRC